MDITNEVMNITSQFQLKKETNKTIHWPRPVHVRKGMV